MPKKIMTVQLSGEDKESGPGEISKIVEKELIKSQAEMLEKGVKGLETTSAKPTGPLLSAEEVTKISIDFLKGLGNNFVMPKRVMKEGERNYTVEIDLKGRIASVLIDRGTKEIVEYEIKDARKETSRGGIEEGGGSSLSAGIIIVVLVMHIILMVAFNFLKLYIDIPFLTGPPAF